MAMEDSSRHPRAPAWRDAVRHAVRALFPEARGLERRRRLRYIVLLLLMIVIAIALTRTGGPGRSSGLLGGHDGQATVSSIALPATDHFSSLETIGGRLLLLGGVQESSVVYGYSVPLADGHGVGTCDAAIVDPHTLAIGPVKTANCGDPSLYGQRVLALTYFSRHAAPGGGATLAVRIARADAQARDGYTLGPIVTTYEQCSDCQAGVIYGDGSLWIYNPTASPSNGSAVLLRISPQTGAVVERWAMPRILRALLAVNSSGLWLSPSLESGVPGGVPRSRLAAYETLYRITRGDRTPQRVLTTETGSGTRWLLASRDTASAAIDNGHGYSAVWTFTAGKRPVHGPKLSDSPMGAEVGAGPPTVAGNNKLGYYNVVMNNGTESVIQTTPDGHNEHTIATIRSPDATDSYPAPTSVTLDGSLFFLDPTTRPDQRTDLHRVTLR